MRNPTGGFSFSAGFNFLTLHDNPTTTTLDTRNLQVSTCASHSITRNIGWNQNQSHLESAEKFCGRWKAVTSIAKSSAQFDPERIALSHIGSPGTSSTNLLQDTLVVGLVLRAFVAMACPNPPLPLQYLRDIC